MYRNRTRAQPSSVPHPYVWWWVSLLHGFGGLGVDRLVPHRRLMRLNIYRPAHGHLLIRLQPCIVVIVLTLCSLGCFVTLKYYFWSVGPAPTHRPTWSSPYVLILIHYSTTAYQLSDYCTSDYVSFVFGVPLCTVPTWGQECGGVETGLVCNEYWWQAARLSRMKLKSNKWIIYFGKYNIYLEHKFR